MITHFSAEYSASSQPAAMRTDIGQLSTTCKGSAVVSRPRRWFALLLAALCLVHGNAAWASCKSTAFLEFKVASTNRIKFGTTGFLGESSEYGDPNVYRIFTDISRDNININICSCMFCNEVRGETNVTVWPLTAELTDIVAGGVDDCGATAAILTKSGSGTITRQVRVDPCAHTNESETCSLVIDGAGAWVYNPSDFPVSGCRRSLAGIPTETILDDYYNYTLEITGLPMGGCGASGALVREYIYSSFYSTPEVANQAISAAIDRIGFVSEWSCSGSGSLSISTYGGCANASAGKFRFKYFGPKDEEDDIVVRLYHSATIREATNLTQWTTNWFQDITNRVTYTGRSQVSGEFDLRPAYGLIGGGMVRSSSVYAEILNSSSCAGPGWAQSETEINSGPFSAFGVGDCAGSPAGFLYFLTDDPVLPPLEAFVNECRAEVLGNIEQVKVDSRLITVASTASSHTINYYSSVGAFNSGTGRYAVVPGSLVATYTVSVISTTPAFRLRVASSLGAQTDFVYTNGVWFIDYGDGVQAAAWAATENGAGVITNQIHQILGPAGQVLAQEVSSYAEIPVSATRVIAQKTTGTGAEAQTSRWFYLTNLAATNINYGKIHLKEDGNGAWERYEYNATTGRKSKTVRVAGNAATNAAEGTVWVEEYDYAPFHTNDTGFFNAGQPRVVYQKLNGTTVGMRGVAYWLNGELEVQFAESYFEASPTNWHQAENLKTYTTTLWYTNGLGSQTLYPDGTVSYSIMTTNVAGTYRTNISLRGACDASLVVTDGTRSISVSTVADGKIRSSTTYDVASGQITDQETYSYFGTDNRSYTITHLDTTTRTYNYNDCCSFLASSLDREGVTTEYLYDIRKRPIGSKTLGVVISNVLDSVGNIVETWRYPSNSPPLKISSFTYDSLGREKSSTDALNNVRTNWYAFAGDGRFITTNKYPDNSIRVEYVNKDGSIDRVVGTAAFPVRYSYDVDATAKQRYTEETKLDGNEGDTSEWTRSYTDAFGRGYKTLFAVPTGSNPYTLQRYNNLGQMDGSRDADGNWTYYTYNTSGELYDSSIDMDGVEARNDAIDRTMRTLTSVVQNGENYWVRRTVSYQLPLAGGADPDSISEVSLDGLRTWNIQFGRTNKTVRTVSGTRTLTATAPDGSYSVSIYAAGQVVSVYQYDKNASQIGGTTLAYDNLLRQWKTTDARNGSSYVAFDNRDRITAITNPPAAVGQSSLVAQTYYDSMGRATNVVQPDGTSLYTSYYSSGLPKRTWGSRSYPVEYTYDAQGRLTNMLTWQSFSGDSGKANTSWKYDPHRGFMASKRYADGQGPAYTNTPGGRLEKRTWARNSLTTTYAYNRAGQMVSAVYSDGTPSVTNLYSLRGFPLTNIWGTNIIRRLYHNAGLLLSENLNGMVVSNRNDSVLRRTNLAVLAGGTTQFYTAGYAFDAAGRLSSVTDGTNSATYSYVANSPLLSQIAFKSNTTTRLVTTKTHDFLNRLIRIHHSNNVSGLLGVSSYAYNTANQRTSVTNLDGSYWVYLYDALGQVTSGRKYWANGAAVSGQQFDYTFDDIGNRQTAASGGNEWGSNQRYQNYMVNTLNQYTQRTVPGYVDVLGSASTGATVTVNYQPTSRQGEYWRRELAIDNSTNAHWLSLTNYAVWPQGGTGDFVTNSTGSVFVPKTPEVFSHDADGNLTNDGRWAYVWDGENRLLSMTGPSTAPSGSRKALHFDYDPQGRRISKIVSNWTGSVWTRALHEKYFYDGWNLMTALNGTNNALVRSFTWGSDLSGSLQGAGGVGGLLLVRDTANNTHFCGHDGNGNVMILVNTLTGTNSATYEYGPFGELLRATGPIAKVNPFRFSNKFQDMESDLVYYGHRYYSSASGRWLTRDPLAEAGGINLYGSVDNDPVGWVDGLGLAKVRIAKSAYKRVADAVKKRGLSALFQVHHKIGQEVFNHPQYGPWLSKLGFTKDEMRNLLVLPTKTGKAFLVATASKHSKRAIHEGRSSLKDYVQPIMKRLDEIKQLDIDDCEKRRLVIELQEELASGLKDGTITINSAEFELLSDGAISLCGLAVIDAKTKQGCLDELELALSVTTYTGQSGIGGVVGKVADFFNPLTDIIELTEEFVEFIFTDLFDVILRLTGRHPGTPYKYR